MNLKKYCFCCNQCDLYKNQIPIFSKISKKDIMWVGMSAQQNKNDLEFKPLDVRTPSGKFIESIENDFQDYSFYKTNLVKCLPLDSKNKIRYPTDEEYMDCFDNFLMEIASVKPKIIFLLGGSVSKFICQKFNIKKEKYVLIKYGNLFIVIIDHPSYLLVYKRKDLQKYKNKIESLIKNHFNTQKY